MPRGNIERQKYSSHLSKWPSTLDGDEWTTSRPRTFYARKERQYLSNRRLSGPPRQSVRFWNRQDPWLRRDSNAGSCSPWPSRYTDYVIPAHSFTQTNTKRRYQQKQMFLRWSVRQATFTNIHIRIVYFWAVQPCSLVGRHQGFIGTCCLYLLFFIRIFSVLTVSWT